jgi:pilus assembly protein CpaF
MTRAVFGLGPLERWLADDDVTEVLVNGGRHVWVERRSARGGTEYVGVLDDGVIDTVIERILTPVGRRLDRTHPVVDARLTDGSRICAVQSPVAVDGTCLSIRKFARLGVPLDRFGAPHLVDLLIRLVDARCNVLVSGATSSGKTTLLNALASHIPSDERIVTLEDTAELALDTPHVLRLETRPASAEGVPGVPMSDLLRTALRLRPDRLVVGEVRGVEAVELVQALNTGHDGSLCTIHANSGAEALSRLESLVVQGTPSWPLAAVRDQVRASIDVVVHVERATDGTRRIESVGEVERHGDNAIRTLADRTGLRAEPTRGRR